MEKNMEKELITMQTETDILEIGLKIKRMETVFYSMKVELFTMDNGLMIRLQIKEKLFTLIKINMKVIS